MRGVLEVPQVPQVLSLPALPQMCCHRVVISSPAPQVFFTFMRLVSHWTLQEVDWTQWTLAIWIVTDSCEGARIDGALDATQHCL